MLLTEKGRNALPLIKKLVFLTEVNASAPQPCFCPFYGDLFLQQMCLCQLSCALPPDSGYDPKYATQAKSLQT